MRSALSQRYSSAFVEVCGVQGCQDFLKKEAKLGALFKDADFLELIHNPFVSYTQKYEVINGVLGFDDEKIQRFLLLLAKSERLSLLPEIVSEISAGASSQKKAYRAVVYCNSKMSAEMLEKISKTLCEKLNLAVEIEEKEWEKDGIKCVIEELDLEISFSKEIFVSSLQKYILDTFRKGV